MITAYHGKADGSAAEVLAVNPFCALRRQPLRGFGGMTARLGPRTRCRHCPSRQCPYASIRRMTSR
jgi:hypothetical protein